MIMNKDKSKSCLDCRYTKEIRIEGAKMLKCEVYSMIIPHHACSNWKKEDRKPAARNG